MPTHRVRVVSVHSLPEGKGNLHTIYVEGDVKGFGAVVTASDWMAASCQRACELGQEVDLQWKDGRIGKIAVDVDLVPQQQKAEGAA